MEPSPQYTPKHGASPFSPQAESSPQVEPSDARRVRRRLAILDGVSAVGVVGFITVLTRGWSGLAMASPFTLGLFGAVAVVASLWWQNSYVITNSITWDGNFRQAWSSIAGVAFAMICLSWLFQLEAARVWLLLVVIGWIGALTFWRLVLNRSQGDAIEPVRVIVAGNTGDALATRLALRSDRRTNYDVQGFVMDRLDDQVPEIVSQMALGSIDHLPHVARKTGANLVVVCLGAIDAERFAPMVRQLNVLGVEVALSTGLSNVALRRVSLGQISGRPLVRVTPAPLGGWHLSAKRALDVLGAGILLGLTGPLMLLTAIAIRIEDGGSAVFSQTRVGKNGEHFTIFKFRTMVNDAEKMLIDLTNDHEGPVFKMRDDPRITRVGKILRKTSIDELPQLFNILRGDMSLVGPRPLPIHEVEAAPASFLDRQTVKPGLTGRWQVSGRSDTGFKELDELDRWYVDNWSLGQDLEILAKTVPAVLMARGAR